MGLTKPPWVKRVLYCFLQTLTVIINLISQSLEFWG